jgi:PKD repeat protein
MKSNLKKLASVMLGIVLIATVFMVAVQTNEWIMNEEEKGLEDADNPNTPVIKNGDFDGYPYKSSTNYDAYFHENVLSDDTVRFESSDGNINGFLSWKMPSELKWVNENNEEDVIGELKSSKVEIEGDKAVYKDVYTNSDISVEYIIKEGVLKENVLLHGDLSYPNFDNTDEGNVNLAIEFTLNFPDDVIIKTNNIEQNGNFQTERNINLYRNGQLVLTVMKPYAQDSKGFGIDCKYKYMVSENSKALILLVPFNWLKEAPYPVAIDPTIGSVPDEPSFKRRDIINDDEIIVIDSDYNDGGSGVSDGIRMYDKSGTNIERWDMDYDDIKRVASGDVNGDDVDEIVVIDTNYDKDAGGISDGILVYDKDENLLYNFDTEKFSLKDIAVGNVTGGPEEEIIVIDGDYNDGGSGTSDGIRIYDKNGNTLYKKDTNRQNLKAIACGDVNDDGTDEIIVIDGDYNDGGSGTSDGFRIYDKTMTQLHGKDTNRQNLKDVACGDVDADLKADIIVIDGDYNDGSSGTSDGYRIYDKSGTQLYAKDTDKHNLRRVASGDINTDGIDEILLLDRDYNDGSWGTSDGIRIYNISGNTLHKWDTNRQALDDIVCGDIDGDSISVEYESKATTDEMNGAPVAVIFAPPFESGFNKASAKITIETSTIEHTSYTVKAGWGISREMSGGVDIKIVEATATWKATYEEEYESKTDYMQTISKKTVWDNIEEDVVIYPKITYWIYTYKIMEGDHQLVLNGEPQYSYIFVPASNGVDLDKMKYTDYLTLIETELEVADVTDLKNELSRYDNHVPGEVASYLDDDSPANSLWYQSETIDHLSSFSIEWGIVTTHGTQTSVERSLKTSFSVGAKAKLLIFKAEDKTEFSFKLSTKYTEGSSETEAIVYEAAWDKLDPQNEAYSYKSFSYGFWGPADEILKSTLIYSHTVSNLGFGYLEISSVEVIDQIPGTLTKPNEPNIIKIKPGYTEGVGKLKVVIDDPTGNGILDISELKAHIYQAPQILGYIVDPAHSHNIEYVIYQDMPEIVKTIELTDTDGDGEWWSNNFDSKGFAVNEFYIIDLELVDSNGNSNIRENQGAFVVTDPIVLGVSLLTDEDFATDIERTFDVRVNTDTMLEITTNQDIYDACICVVEYGENINPDYGQTDLRRKTDIGKFIQIDASKNLNDVSSTSVIKFYYDDIDGDGFVDGTRVKEDSLGLYWWNGYFWQDAPGEKDTTENYVSGIVNHFGYFAPFGNSIPLATPGFDLTVNQGEMVSFDGTSSYDVDGEIILYDWNFGDPYADDLNPNIAMGANPSHIFYLDGTYTVTLTVTDNFGDLDTKTMLVTVLNVDPVSDAGPSQTVNEGDIVYFDGSGSHRDYGTILTHEWDFQDPKANTMNPNYAVGPNPTHIYYEDGVYPVTLTITDNYGEVQTDTTTVTVLNVAPTADAGPDQPINVGHVVSFLGTATDPANMDPMMNPMAPYDPLTYNWDFDAIGGIGVDATGPSVSHTYMTEGTYIVTLTVSDDDGGVGTDTCIVYVTRRDTILSEPRGQIVYSDSEIIYVTLLDEDSNPLLDQAATPKTVYLEFEVMNTWVVISQDTLDSIDDSEYGLELAFDLPQMPDFDPVSGTYINDIRVRFDGDYRYSSTVSYGTLTILKENVILSDPGFSIVYSDSSTVTVTMEDNDGEQILHQTDELKTLYLEYTLLGGDGTWIVLDSQTLSSGQVTFNIDSPQFRFDLPADMYCLRVRYDGDERYEPTSTTSILRLDKETTQLSDPSVSVVYSDDASVIVSMEDDDSEPILHQDDEPKTLYLDCSPDSGLSWITLDSQTLESGQVTFNFNSPQDDFDLPSGTYDLRVRFEGDSRYNPSVTQGILTIYKENTVLSDPSLSMTYSDIGTIIVTMVDNDANEILHQSDESKILYLEVNDGGVNWIILDTKILAGGATSFEFILPQVVFDGIPGSYPLRVRYDGDTRYVGDITEGTLTVGKEASTLMDLPDMLLIIDNITISGTILDNDDGALLHQFDQPKPIYLEYNSKVYGWTVISTAILNSGDDSTFEFDLYFDQTKLTMEEIAETYLLRLRFDGDSRYEPDFSEIFVLDASYNSRLMWAIEKVQELIDHPDTNTMHDNELGKAVTELQVALADVSNSNPAERYYIQSFGRVKLAIDHLEKSSVHPYGIEGLSLKYIGAKEPVNIYTFDKFTMLDAFYNVSANDEIFIDNRIYVDNSLLPKGKLGQKTTLKVYDINGILLDTVEINTSGIKDLSSGDKYGGFEIVSVNYIGPDTTFIRGVLERSVRDRTTITIVNAEKIAGSADPNIISAYTHYNDALSYLDAGDYANAIKEFKFAYQDALNAI